MTGFLKKYGAELLVFGMIAAILLIDQVPDITWINTNCDGPHYIYAAKYLYPSHKTSAPLYLLLGHLFLWLPIGTEAWRMALISTLSGFTGSVFIYLITKKFAFTHKRLFGIIAATIYGGSALALSQNIIIETYPLLTTACIVAFYFTITNKWLLSIVFMGIALAIHPLSMLFIIPMLIKCKELRQWKLIAVLGSFLLFYLYIPITNRAPYMWNTPNNEGGVFGFIQDTLATGQMLSGGLSIWDFPKRIIDTGSQLLLNFAVIGIIPLVIAFWKTKVLKNILFWLIILPIIYYMTDLSPQTYVYMQSSIAFGAIAIGIGLERIKIWPKIASYATLGFALFFLGFNANYFDVGRTLDKNLSAREFYNNELAKVPEGQILMAQQGWEWAIVFPYNMNEHRNILPVSVGTLANVKYQEMLHSWGIKFDIPTKQEVKDRKLTLTDIQTLTTESILKNNENVWITVPSDARTYGAMIIPAKGNEDKVTEAPLSITNGSRDMIWNWKPSNPYDITTGAIEVDEWNYIIFSNYNVLVFTMLSAIGAIPTWMFYMIVFKKKKWSAKRVKEKVMSEI